MGPRAFASLPPLDLDGVRAPLVRVSRCSEAELRRVAGASPTAPLPRVDLAAQRLR